MAKEFLGRGWKYPVALDGKGGIALAGHEEDIREAIRIILGTAPGERVMRPEFGCGIHEYVFSVVNATTLRLVENRVREALVRWEPRIDLVGVRAEAGGAGEGTLLVHVDYRVRASNTRSNLVFPFYLKEG
jgi:phage baseplate assembly protein W